MAASSVITVDDSGATQLATGLKKVVLYVPGGGPAVYIGGSNVTLANGFPANPGTPFEVPIGLALGEAIYAIAPTGYSVDVNVLTFSTV